MNVNSVATIAKSQTNPRYTATDDLWKVVGYTATDDLWRVVGYTATDDLWK